MRFQKILYIIIVYSVNRLTYHLSSKKKEFINILVMNYS